MFSVNFTNEIGMVPLNSSIAVNLEPYLCHDDVS